MSLKVNFRPQAGKFRESERYSEEIELSPTQANMVCHKSLVWAIHCRLTVLIP